MHTQGQRHARAFFISGEKIIHLANAGGAGVTYQAMPQRIAPGAQSAARCHDSAETVIVVEAGAIELMINGTELPLGAGQYAKVAPGQWFAWRNAGRGVAEVLVKTAPPNGHKRACKVTLSIAAA